MGDLADGRVRPVTVDRHTICLTRCGDEYGAREWRTFYSGNLTPSGTQGSAFTFTPAFGTVTAPYALSGTLPTGLTLNTSTGVLSGTPTSATSFTIPGCITFSALLRPIFTCSARYT